MPKGKSKPVLEFATVAVAARRMNKILNTYVSPAGKGADQHFALHHSQISPDPYNFFVVSRIVHGGAEGEIMVVLNPTILEKDSSTRKKVREGCMSFPFRNGIEVNRYGRIKVSYDVPDADGKKMIHKEEWMEGFIAQIFQHEVQHAKGSHIYEGTKSH